MLAQADVGNENPQITHGHAHGVQLGKLRQNGGSAGDQDLDQDNGTGEHHDQLDAVDVGTVPVLFQHGTGDVVLGIVIAQQHAQGSVDGNDQGGELADGVTDGIDDDKQVAHTKVFANLLEGPVSAVGYIGIEGFRGSVDDGGIEHHAHGDGAENGTDHHHDRQGDHTLGEIPGGFVHLIDIGRDLLAAAYGEHQNGKGSEVIDVKFRNQVPGAEIHGNIAAVGIDDGCYEHHNDEQDGHDEHSGACKGGNALQNTHAPAGNVAENQENRQGCKLNPQRGQGVIHFRVAENSPAQGFQAAGAFRGNIGNVNGPVGPASIVSGLAAEGALNPGGHAAAGILKAEPSSPTISA